MSIREVLARIAARAPVTDIVEERLDTFAHRGMILQVWSVLLDDTVWFVSGPEQVKALVDKGIRRGTIYTAGELIILLEMVDIAGDQEDT